MQREMLRFREKARVNLCLEFY